MNMMGKRVNYAARSVISPDPYIGAGAARARSPKPVREKLHMLTLTMPGCSSFVFVWSWTLSNNCSQTADMGCPQVCTSGGSSDLNVNSVVPRTLNLL